MNNTNDILDIFPKLLNNISEQYITLFLENHYAKFKKYCDRISTVMFSHRIL